MGVAVFAVVAATAALPVPVTGVAVCCSIAVVVAALAGEGWSHLCEWRIRLEMTRPATYKHTIINTCLTKNARNNIKRKGVGMHHKFLQTF
jgi:hypothetical protein